MKGTPAWMLSGLLLCAPAFAQQEAKPSPSKAPAEAPARPAPAKSSEMERIAFLLGEWRYVNEYAAGDQDSGSYSARLGPGGHSIITEFSGSGPAGEFSGLEVFTWNAAARQYEAYAFLSLAPGGAMRTGQWEGDTLVFTRKGAGQELRYVYKTSGEDSLTIEMYLKAGEQPLKLLLTTRARKAGSAD